MPPTGSLHATILLGTLKRRSSKEFSHTAVMCELLSDELARHDVTTEVIRLAEHVILPGTKSRVGGSDEWPGILQKLMKADIIILATPVWWGGHSSLMQRVLERLDDLNDELVETGKSELLNKAGGMVITGAEDGAQHIIGSLANFMVWNGLTLPPACSLSFLGDYTAKTPAGLKRVFMKQKRIVGMAKTMARNLAHVANLLREHPLPVQETNSQAFR